MRCVGDNSQQTFSRVVDVVAAFCASAPIAAEKLARDALRVVRAMRNFGVTAAASANCNSAAATCCANSASCTLATSICIDNWLLARDADTVDFDARRRKLRACRRRHQSIAAAKEALSAENSDGLQGEWVWRNGLPRASSTVLPLRFQAAEGQQTPRLLGQFAHTLLGTRKGGGSSVLHRSHCATDREALRRPLRDAVLRRAHFASLPLQEAQLSSETSEIRVF